MDDPATTPGDTPHRRDRRRARARRKVRRAVGVVGTVVLVAVIALLAVDVVRFGGDNTPSLAGTVHASGGDEPAAAATTTTTTVPRDCRPLSTTDPLRLWIGGDSLAGSLGPALGDLTGATGVVQPYFDSRVSSGLADPGFFDWPDHATTEMARLDPEIVVFIVGANDWTDVSGSWKADYAAKVDSMMTTLVGSGRTVYWLGSPTLQDKKMDAAVVQVNAIAQGQAARHARVHYVDTYKLFSDADGTFSFDLPDDNGKVQTMRTGDGVHFTTDGADYLARQVYKLVDLQCAVTEQKVEGAAKEPIQTEGSTQVAPGGASGSSDTSPGTGSSGYSGTVETTPPATAPPSTSLPVDTTPATEPTTTQPTVTTSTP
jgi:uncharacterized protein